MTLTTWYPMPVSGLFANSDAHFSDSVITG
jgi:hypothetical protein